MSLAELMVVSGALRAGMADGDSGGGLIESVGWSRDVTFRIDEGHRVTNYMAPGVC